MTTAQPPTPTLYAASLILVGSGEKRATLSDETFTYNADHLLVVTSPLPMLCRTIASATKPVLTVVIEIDPLLLRELLLIAPDIATQTTVPARTVFRLPLSGEIEDAAARLLRHLASDHRAAALARETIREILFLVLDGPHGESLRAVVDGTSRHLSHVLRHMNTSFAKKVSVEELARLAHTSVSGFHQRFKAMTGASPLQYMKALRLTRGRQMLSEGALVKTVAHDVGYESESQFSREYRRFFGVPPSSHASPRVRERSRP